MSESDSSSPASLLMGCKAFFFCIPFMIAGTFIIMIRESQCLKRHCSLANEEEPLGALELARPSQIQSSFMALWQRFRKESCTVHALEQNSDPQADLSDDLLMSIAVLALPLRPLNRPAETS